MLLLILRRLLFGLLTLFGTSLLVFGATQLLPGDVAEAVLGQEATPALVEAFRKEAGLDRPLVDRYVEWVAGFATGDLGTSLTNRTDVAQSLLPRLKNSLFLAIYALGVAVPVATLLALLSAAYPGRLLDRIAGSTSVFLTALPDFVIALVLVTVMAVKIKLFPSVVPRPDWYHLSQGLQQTFLPMLTLVCALLAHMVRMGRAALVDVLGTSYIEMALLKGAQKWRILLSHAIPNAIGPLFSVLALSIGYLVSGVVVVEVVFSYPGMGRYLVDAIFYRDMPVIQSAVMIFCAVYILANVLADISLIAFNPKIRFRR
ncbi:ABC transporter permease [Mesorhizobium sp. M1329]|uniref:ABC transporter permease n=1 Tax=Mesorhizobium sp. M1329 TaxID=2957083 RepID=UPI00333A3067